MAVNCSVLPKEVEGSAGVTLIDCKAGGAPLPVKLTLCVLPVMLLLLSVIVKEAVRLPAAVGVNVTLIVQLPLAATELPQVLADWPKSPGLEPVNVTLPIVRAAFPVLLRVTDWAALVVPVAWLAKVKLGCETPAIGAGGGVVLPPPPPPPPQPTKLLKLAIAKKMSSNAADCRRCANKRAGAITRTPDH